MYNMGNCNLLQSVGYMDNTYKPITRLDVVAETMGISQKVAKECQQPKCKQTKLKKRKLGDKWRSKPPKFGSLLTGFYGTECFT